MSAQIIRLRPPCANEHDGLTPEHRAFCQARRTMNERFLLWLRAEAGRDLVRDEIAATLAVLQQLEELERTQ